MVDEEGGAPPVALVTGAGRPAGIGAAVARALAADGWDVGLTWWQPYDERMPWGSTPGEAQVVLDAVRTAGAEVHGLPADLSDPEAPDVVLAEVGRALGPVRALVLCHCESVDGGLFDTSVESFDRHMAVNARATWLLVRAFARQFDGPAGRGRIVGLTSDHTAGNLAYGASKGALDRIVLAAAVELAEAGITANVVNPGPTDTGWMDDRMLRRVAATTLAGRVGQPTDAAHLVAFLCSAAGGWVNGQLLHSDGGQA